MTAKQLDQTRLDESDQTIFSSAIIYTSQASLGAVAKKSLEDRGLPSVAVVSSHSACIEQLTDVRDALLIVDSGHELKSLNQLLRAAQQDRVVAPRPVLLLCSHLSFEAVALASDYKVARLLIGELNKENFGTHFDQIAARHSQFNKLSEQLTAVDAAILETDNNLAIQLLEELRVKGSTSELVACELANRLIEADRWDEAQNLIEEAIESHPGASRAKQLRARCLMHQRRFDDAASLLKECQVTNPFNPDRLNQLGQALLEGRAYSEASESFAAAQEVDPDSPEAQAGLVQCQLLEGEVNGALELLGSASSPREVASIFNGAAILAIRHGRFDDGENLYHTALSRVENLGEIAARLHFNLGLSYLKNDLTHKAHESFERAVDLDSSYEFAKHNLQIVANRLQAASDGDDQQIDNESQLDRAGLDIKQMSSTARNSVDQPVAEVTQENLEKTLEDSLEKELAKSPTKRTLNDAKGQGQDPGQSDDDSATDGLEDESF